MSAAAAPDLFAAPAEVADEPDGCPVCGLDPCGCRVELKGKTPRGVLPMVERTPAPPALAANHPFAAVAVARRTALEAKHGERACTGADRPAYSMARDLHERAGALVDRLSGAEPSSATPEGRERVALALNTLASVGALAMALHDNLKAVAAS